MHIDIYNDLDDFIKQFTTTQKDATIKCDPNDIKNSPFSEIVYCKKLNRYKTKNKLVPVNLKLKIEKLTEEENKRKRKLISALVLDFAESSHEDSKEKQAQLKLLKVKENI